MVYGCEHFLVALQIMQISFECTVTNPNQNIVYVDLELEMNVIGVEIESDLGGSFSIQGGKKIRSLSLRCKIILSSGMVASILS